MWWILLLLVARIDVAWGVHVVPRVVALPFILLELTHIPSLLILSAFGLGSGGAAAWALDRWEIDWIKQGQYLFVVEIAQVFGNGHSIQFQGASSELFGLLFR